MDKINSPIFLFTTGWRTGSTMLQRLLISSNEALIWGESGGALNDFEHAYQAYVQMTGDGSQYYKAGFGGNGEKQYKMFLDTVKSERANNWIASLNPPIADIAEQFKCSINNLYAKTVNDLGYGRWGIKDVLANNETAIWLKKLYPDAKFIFLFRHPYDCMLSIKRREWMDKKNISDPLSFYANHWLNQAKGFRELDFGFKVKYESLLNDKNTFEELKKYVDINKIEYEFIQRSRADWKAHNTKKLTFIERFRIKNIAASEASLHGYKL